jgi:hypothetical protein
MSNPATPLDNQAAISQINNSINFLITEFLRPTALQTQANAVAIDNLTADLQITRQVVDDLATESLLDGRRSANNSANIENLLAESREDRRRSDERFAEERRLSDEHLAEEHRLSDERFAEERRLSDERFAEERRLSDKSFNAQMAEMRALGEQNRALLSALAHTNERVDSLEKAS